MIVIVVSRMPTVPNPPRNRCDTARRPGRFGRMPVDFNLLKRHLFVTRKEIRGWCDTHLDGRRGSARLVSHIAYAERTARAIGPVDWFGLIAELETKGR
ncbi:MAG: hypothetical protein ACTS3R_02970 [Inquilinaceae bacterium]